MKKKASFTLNDEEYFYRKNGHGNKQVLLIHDNFTTSRYFQPIMNMINKDNFSLYAPDLMGCGHSSYFNPSRLFLNYVNYVQNFCNHLYLDKFIIIGWGIGGAIGLQLAAQMNKQVDSIILINPNAYDINSDEDIEIKNKNLEKIITDINAQDQAQLAYDFTKQYYVYMTPSFHEEDVLMKETLLQKNPLDLSLAMKISNIPNETLKIINSKTFILYGEMDSTINPIFRKKINENIKNHDCRIINHSGHMMMIDDPQSIVDTLNEAFMITTE